MNAAIIGGGALIVTLLVWVILHHARPEMKVEVGVKAWINLARPPLPDDSPQNQEPGGDGEDGEADGDDRPHARPVDPPNH